MLFLPRQRAKVYLNLCPSTKDYGVFFCIFVKVFLFWDTREYFLLQICSKVSPKVKLNRVATTLGVGEDVMPLVLTSCPVSVSDVT